MQKFRGTTARIEVEEFSDFSGNPFTPAGALVQFDYPNLSGGRSQASLAMSPSSPPCGRWVALVDTRGMGLGPLYFSVHTTNYPVCVRDGSFEIVAGPANLVTF